MCEAPELASKVRSSSTRTLLLPFLALATILTRRVFRLLTNFDSKVVHFNAFRLRFRSAAMARGSQNEASTPRPPPALKTSTSTASSTGKEKQQSIAGFFQKRTAPLASTPAKRAADSNMSKSAEASSTIGPGSSPRTAPGASQSSAVNCLGKENGKCPISSRAEYRLTD